MANEVHKNPEPVPPASQLAVLPFLAAVSGFLRAGREVQDLRITIHRVMSREGQGYLQQLCGYVDETGLDWRGKVGRTFPVNEGIMGAAYGSKLVWRTKHFSSREELILQMQRDMKAVGDGRDPNSVAISYLAIPFLNSKLEPTLILYADCKVLNFFADNARVRNVVSMCNGICRLFDWLQKEPFPSLRNFPLQMGKPVQGARTLYISIQESLNDMKPPQFQEVSSLNYEATVA